MSESSEELKKKVCMESVFKALEDGWTVKKSSSGPRTFEFTKSSFDKPPVDDSKHPTSRRSISAPIVKNPKNNST